MKRIGSVDVNVEYTIRNNGDILFTEKETLAVETQVSFVKSFRVPSNLEPGHYNFDVVIYYLGDVIGTSSSLFTVTGDAVEEKPGLISRLDSLLLTQDKYWSYILGGVVIFSIIILTAEETYKRKIKKNIKRRRDKRKAKKNKHIKETKSKSKKTKHRKK
jgi:hypothetical protein